MKELLKIVILILIPLFFNASDKDLLKVRELYYKASTNRADAEVFFKTISSFTSIDKSLVQGYKGMSYMIKANFDFNPYYKLSFFVTGKNLLNAAIEADPENMELRFLRFCVQTNAPGFLAYSGKITEDKTSIKKSYPTLQDLDLKKRVQEYMISSKSCSKEEKIFFKEPIKAVN